MDITTLLLFILGLILLIGGAEFLVKGASQIAERLGLSRLVIGLTIVAFGTSAPELTVSVMSAYSGQADIALGNVVGSNIFNILFILGMSAIVSPLIVSVQLIKLDVPIMIAGSLAVLLLGYDGSISTIDGIILFSGILAYTSFLVYQSRKINKQTKKEKEELNEDARKFSPAIQLIINITLIVIGLAMLIAGSKFLVDGAVAAARSFGVSELIIGLTVVAAGTSLPELAASVVASYRGERDIAVGNAVGSNIFNILSVLGASAIISPSGINISSAALQFDIPVMIAVALVCLPIFFTGSIISRFEGSLFVLYYIAYTVYLIITATSSHFAEPYEKGILIYALPLTLIIIGFMTFKDFKNRRKKV